MAQKAASKRTYPWTTTIKDKKVTLKMLTAKDKDALLNFARSLPEDDLLFLSLDITNPEMVDHCIEQVNAGRFNVILADVDGKLVSLEVADEVDHRLVHALEVRSVECRVRGRSQELLRRGVELFDRHSLERLHDPPEQLSNVRIIAAVVVGYSLT